jgi:hypothetical protein
VAAVAVASLLSACVAAGVASTPTPTRPPTGSVLPQPAAPTPTAPAWRLPTPASPPPALVPPVGSPAAGQRGFAGAYSVASATRHQAWLILERLFEAPAPPGLTAAHEEVCARYLALIAQLEVPPAALAGLRTLQERAEQDIAAQRQARAMVQHYWVSQRGEDMARAREMQRRAATANEEALRVAEALGMALP